MAQYITEVLRDINSNPSLLNSTYKKQGDGGPLGILFRHAFIPEGKFLLPEGLPPFKPDAAPMGMSPARFITETRKFYLFCRADLTPIKRETMFVQLCEAVHPDEAKILIAIKDQNLTSLYPNITHKVVADAGFVPQPPQQPVAVVGEQAPKKESGLRGRPRKNPVPAQQ